MKSSFLTTVLDAGARYGMHPSWRNFCGDLRYIAFEPDPEEAERLRKHNDECSMEVVESALYNRVGEFDFHLLAHRGMSSFLRPDMESEAFKDLKPGQGKIEKIIKIKTQTIDYFAKENGWAVDFLKVDTEGTEHEVIESADEAIDRGVLGIRSSVNFNHAFHEQTLFSTTHDYLVHKGFMLLNMDYFGYGYPKLGLFKKPDPNMPETGRYGVMVACDAVWIQRPENLFKLFTELEKLEAGKMKLAFFCLLNGAPDVAADILQSFIMRQGGWQSEGSRNSRLYKALRFEMAKYLGKWRTVPDETWDRARSIYETIFEESLGGGSRFYPQVQTMANDLGINFFE
jgi:FkbM family methyltransferase